MDMVVDAATAEPERTIPFTSVFNFRDLGGYLGADGRAVRWRVLFRADGLHRLTADEMPRVRALGIATVIDLRTPDELEARGRFPAVADVDYRHLPLFDVVPDWTNFPDVAAPGFLADRYMEMLDSGQAAVATVLQVLAAPASLPAVFHCAAGKDRTGIVASLVLRLLGVDRDTVVADYALSHDAMARLEAWIASEHPEYTRSGSGMPDAVMTARPETMRRFLAAVEARYGSVEGLVADLGFDGAAVKALRANLLN